LLFLPTTMWLCSWNIWKAVDVCILLKTHIVLLLLCRLGTSWMWQYIVEWVQFLVCSLLIYSVPSIYPSINSFYAIARASECRSIWPCKSAEPLHFGFLGHVLSKFSPSLYFNCPGSQGDYTQTLVRLSCKCRGGGYSFSRVGPLLEKETSRISFETFAL
jgi:hypothetical protein